MIAKVTARTELGPSRACRRLDMRESLCGMRVSPAQCAPLTLTPDVVWDRGFRSGYLADEGARHFIFSRRV